MSRWWTCARGCPKKSCTVLSGSRRGRPKTGFLSLWWNTMEVSATLSDQLQAAKVPNLRALNSRLHQKIRKLHGLGALERLLSTLSNLRRSKARPKRFPSTLWKARMIKRHFSKEHKSFWLAASGDHWTIQIGKSARSSDKKMSSKASTSRSRLVWALTRPT